MPFGAGNAKLQTAMALPRRWFAIRILRESISERKHYTAGIGHTDPLYICARLDGTSSRDIKVHWGSRVNAVAATDTLAIDR